MSECNRRAGRGLVLALGVYWLAACSAVGPDYQGAPKLALPQAWNQQFEGPSATAQSLSQWWLRFNDPVLSELIAQAATKNLDLELTMARVNEARAGMALSGSQQLPTIDSTGALRREQSSAKGSFFPARLEDGHSLAVGLAWELDLFGRIRRQNEAATANWQASIENYRDALVVLNSEIARHYITVRTLQERLRLAKRNVSTQRESSRVVRARYQAELTSELDLNQAKQNLARSQSAIPLLEGSLTKAINRLAVLLGQAPGSLQAMLAEPKPIPSLPSHMTVPVPRELLRQRPDIRRAERQLAAQFANIGVTTAELYPRFSLSGNFGVSTLSGSVFSKPAQFWAIGPNIGWNVFDGKRRRAQIDIAQAGADQASAAYEKTVLSAMEDVEASLINYVQEQKRITYLRASAEAAAKTVTIAQSQYRNGLTSFQTVLDAERVLFAEEDRLASSMGELASHVVNIYRAFGGGWSGAVNAANDSRE